MKLSTGLLIAFIAFLNASVEANSNDTLPSFHWDLEFFNNHSRKQIKGTIKYNNGKQDDIAMLFYHNPIVIEGERPEHIDPCIFKGYLANRNVTISMNGCPDQERQEIVLAGKTLESGEFVVLNGTTVAFTVDEEKAEDDVSAQGPALQQRDIGTHQTPQETLPRSLMLNISLDVDQEFHNRFGDDTVNALRRVMNEAKQMFELPGLDTKIKLNVVGNVFALNHHLNAAVTNDFEKAQMSAEDSSTEAHIYLVFSLCNGNSPYGRFARVGSVCAKSRSSRTALVEYFSSDLFAARTVVRLVGHSLGMWPDYHVVNGIGVMDPPKHDREAVKCTNQGGMMDCFGPVRNKWTACSNEYLQDYYNNVVSVSGSFCAFNHTEDTEV